MNPRVKTRIDEIGDLLDRLASPRTFSIAFIVALLYAMFEAVPKIADRVMTRYEAAMEKLVKVTEDGDKAIIQALKDSEARNDKERDEAVRRLEAARNR